MKKWALLTALLYAIILAVLAGPLVLAAFWLEFVPGEVYIYWHLWAWIGIMALAQIALLVVPVRMASRRPVSRRHIFWPFLAAFFLVLVMASAMCLAVWETVAQMGTPWADSSVAIAIVAVVGSIWLLWTFLFGFYTGSREPKTIMSRIAKFLVAGSILELLVAVPAHAIARVKNYCCAGFFTFWGLATGLSVMLFAFGPAVFMLFVRRYGSVRMKPDK